MEEVLCPLTASVRTAARQLAIAAVCGSPMGTGAEGETRANPRSVVLCRCAGHTPVWEEVALRGQEGPEELGFCAGDPTLCAGRDRQGKVGA